MPGASVVTHGGGGTKRRVSEPATTRGGNFASGSGHTGQMPRKSSTELVAAGRVNGAGGGGGGGQLSTAAVMKMKAEGFEKDRDNFLNTFEKPTQIYRFLRARMVESPIFLQRNLSYMKARMSRSHTSRENFTVDCLLERVQQSQKEDKYVKLPFGSPRGGLGVHPKGPVNFYNIILLGITDGQMWAPDTKAKIDVCIARVLLKRRKEGMQAVDKPFEKSVDFKIYSPLSPTSSHDIAIPLPSKCPVISVPASDCFTGSNGHTVLSYKLIIRVSLPQVCLQQESKTEQQTNNHLNSRNNNNNASDNLDEPKAKRRRSAPATKDRENFVYEDTAKGSGVGGAGVPRDPADSLLIYTGHISLYELDIPGDKFREVDFDLQLKRVTKGAANKMSYQRIKREISWENLDEKNSKVLEQSKPAGKCAKLSVSIRTSSEKLPSLIEPPPSLMSKAVVKKDDGALSDSGASSLARLETQKSIRVIYNFMYGTNSQQQTESRDDLRCPWCSLNCMRLYSLMKHLKLCHPRYQFIYTPLPNGNGVKIEVSINDSYDGSYSGSAFDLVCQPPGEAFARNGPTKRTEVFSILVCRPKPAYQSLQEFFECDEKDAEQRRTYITGHNRLYHHTSTCLPIHPREIDVDSEGEPDPEWLRVKTTMMIDEFTDVNEGEKELMKLWNLHVMKYNYVGDCQIPLSCKRFVELHGKEIIAKNLYRNFCLHVTNLYDFGLLTPQGVHSTIQLLHSQMKDSNSGPSAHIQKLAQNKQVKNGMNGVDMKIPSNPIKSFSSSNNGALTNTNSKTGSAATTALNDIKSKATFSANSSTTANNPSSSVSAAAAALNRKILEVKVAKLPMSATAVTSVGTRNSK